HLCVYERLRQIKWILLQKFASQAVTANFFSIFLLFANEPKFDKFLQLFYVRGTKFLGKFFVFLRKKSLFCGLQRHAALFWRLIVFVHHNVRRVRRIWLCFSISRFIN